VVARGGRRGENPEFRQVQEIEFGKIDPWDM
jgi:hypothetical protein